MKNVEKLTGASKEVENTKVEQFDKINIENNEPFCIVGKKGNYSIAMGNNVVCERKFRDENEAKAYLDKRPWEVILLATYIYREKMKAYIESIEKQ